MDMKKICGTKILNDIDNYSINDRLYISDKLYISKELEKNVDNNGGNAKYDALIICSKYLHF